MPDLLSLLVLWVAALLGTFVGISTTTAGQEGETAAVAWVAGMAVLFMFAAAVLLAGVTS